MMNSDQPKGLFLIQLGMLFLIAATFSAGYFVLSDVRLAFVTTLIYGIFACWMLVVAVLIGVWVKLDLRTAWNRTLMDDILVDLLIASMMLMCSGSMLLI